MMDISEIIVFIWVIGSIVCIVSALWLVLENWFRYHILRQPKVGELYKFQFNDYDSMVVVTKREKGKIYSTILEINGSDYNIDIDHDYETFLMIYKKVQ